MKATIKRCCLLIGCLGLWGGYLFPGSVTAQPCEQWAGKIVSAQGMVEVRKAGEVRWVAVKLNETICPGDMVRVHRNSRAAVVLINQALVRLDQNTTIAFKGLDEQKTFLLDMLSGVAHFFSRFPRRLKVKTSFVNAAIEGTEFYLRVTADETLMSIFEGNVAASNEAGSLVLASGQSAVARAARAPLLQAIVRPRDAVQWALYYPPIVDWRVSDFSGGPETGWQTKVRRSIDFYWQGNITQAFNALEKAPANISDPRFFLYRASLFLTVGRVAQAQADTSKALQLDPANSQAVALQSIIDVARNKKDRAFELAKKAIELDSKVAAAWVALSYVQQSQFDLRAALESLEEAVNLDPDNALVLARLAELHLSVGELDKSSKAAQRAVKLNPNLARTQTIMGFALITRIKIKAAKDSFQKAIQLDSAAPLPRLGLGLAKIRDGDLKAGRAEIEIAASLDPNNSLIRSYLGKAYFDEKRGKLAANQYEIAKELDPLDPTPWFYGAIHKQTTNRPVEALQDIQKSIELNQNRAVYRSRLQLDQDLAARSSSLSRIYSDLGFQQRALVEGWKSVNKDPTNYSAHRFLADAYLALSRHEIAKVSELLQSQLLQPLNINPVQPQLAESNLFILEGAGPADPSFNEFNSLFLRNRLALQASGVAGENDTVGDEITQSGVWNNFSYSLGQFHYETDGFRKNNDQDLDIYDLFTQLTLSPKTSVQGEFRYKDVDKGDLSIRFDPANFIPTLKQEEEFRSVRFGFHHAIATHSDFIGSVIYRWADGRSMSSTGIGLDIDTDDDGYLGEGQYLFRSKRFDMISGIGHFDGDRKDDTTTTIFPPPPLPPITTTTKEDNDIHHTNAYIYSVIKFPENFIWTLGGSADFFDGGIKDRDQFNPKFGLTWYPFPGTSVRAAVFKTLKRTLIASQTIEPTQVAGFNQFFDDTEATKAWRYGVGIDQTFSSSFYMGAEFSKRNLDVPFEDVLSSQVQEADWKEYLARAYLFWTPLNELALSAEYQFEKFDREPKASGEEDIVDLKTHRFPFGVSYFHPIGLFVKLKTSFVYQDGDFGNNLSGVESDDDQFWVVDASMGYRLPKRFGLLSIQANNIFKEKFKFQDTDPKKPTISPERFVLARITLAF